MLTLALTLTACTTHYQKPGATTADFEADKARCDYEASSVAMPSMSLVTYYDLMGKCLAARGWRQE
jgi:hypothetical protein